jgi:hypothetical protein
MIEHFVKNSKCGTISQHDNNIELCKSIGLACWYGKNIMI